MIYLFKGTVRRQFLFLLYQLRPPAVQAVAGEPECRNIFYPGRHHLTNFNKELIYNECQRRHMTVLCEGERR